MWPPPCQHQTSSSFSCCSFQYFILSFRPLFLTHWKSSTPTKCLVLYFFCSFRSSNIQRIGLQHSGLPSPAFRVNPQTAPRGALKHMHISGAVTWAWFKQRAPQRLSPARSEKMTHHKANVIHKDAVAHGIHRPIYNSDGAQGGRSWGWKKRRGAERWQASRNIIPKQANTCLRIGLCCCSH